MTFFNQLSLKSKLLALLLGVSLGSLLIAGILSWWRFRSTFQNQVLQQLTSVRAAKADQVEAYLQNLRNHMETLSEDRMIVSAMVEFNTAYKTLQSATIPPEWSDKIEVFYEEEFFPQLSNNISGEKVFANYRPTTQAGQYLQYHYIANNPALIGEKDNRDNAQDGSQYSQIHAKYHPLLRNLTQKLGYYDLFLIDFDTAEVVYSVNKQTDYATSLDRGPYRRSNLATVMEAVRDNPGQRFVQVVDFKPYAPSFAAPAAFYAAPIYNGPHIIGILAVQVPVDQINSIMTGNQEWEDSGLGKTGEVYLVGSDLLMRSISRFFIEDPKEYEANLRQSGLSAQTIELIQKLNTSVLLQPVETEAARLAIAGNVDTTVINNYRGIPVLSSYAPLRIDGLDWVILAEIDRSEALIPVYTLQAYLLTLGAILGLLITWVANLVVRTFTQPIQALNEAARELGEGKQEIKNIHFNTDNELGELGQALNKMLEEMLAKDQLIAQKEQQNDALLANILPVPVIEQLKQGDKQIASQIQQVTVLCAQIVGLSELAQQLPANQTSEILNRFVDAFDQIAKEEGLEKQSVMGTHYMAVCALSKAYLDHPERAVNCAIKMLNVVQPINHEYGLEIYLKIGIHSGSITAGIVGTQKFMYNIWGETVNSVLLISNLKTELGSSCILVTQVIYNRLQDAYTFTPYQTIHGEEIGELKTFIISH